MHRESDNKPNIGNDDDGLVVNGISTTPAAKAPPSTLKPARGDAFFDEIFTREAGDAITRGSETIRIASDFKMREVVLALSNREILEERFTIKPSVFLWPFPMWNKDTSRLEIQVFSFDVKDTSNPLEEINNELLGLASFRSKEGSEISKGEVNNLIRAISEFIYEVCCHPNKSKFDQIPDYEKTALTLQKALFAPARDATGNLYKYRFGKAELVIDYMKAIEFRNWLIEYFMAKHREIRKEIDAVRGRSELVLSGPKGAEAAQGTAERVLRIVDGRSITKKSQGEK